MPDHHVATQNGFIDTSTDDDDDPDERQQRSLLSKRSKGAKKSLKKLSPWKGRSKDHISGRLQISKSYIHVLTA
jgi:hypothetical protein